MKSTSRPFHLMLAGVMAMATLMASAEEDRSAVLDRIKPVGVVAIAGQPAPAAKQSAAAAPVVAPAATTAAEPASGEGVYKKACFVCHDAGVAGAPKLGDKDAWTSRVSKGAEGLLASAINGTAKGMPPRGTCAACSDNELKAAVEYMVSKAQ